MRSRAVQYMSFCSLCKSLNAKATAAAETTSDNRKSYRGSCKTQSSEQRKYINICLNLCLPKLMFKHAFKQYLSHFHSDKVINPISLSPISYLLLLVEPKRVAVEEQGTSRRGGWSMWILNACLILLVRAWRQSGVRSRQLWKTLNGGSLVLAMVATWAPYAGHQWCLGLSAGLWREFLGSVEKDFQLAPKKFWQTVQQFRKEI